MKLPADNVNSQEKAGELINILREKTGLLTNKKITAGFDGFIDTIVRIIKAREEQGAADLFTHIKEFGEYIIGKEGSSFSLETEDISVRMGGNMPIMSNAMGKMGASVNCIGAFGYPQPLPVFENISSNCQLYSFCDPGTSTAFEFNDGKILLAKMGKLNELGWDAIKSIIGTEKLLDLYSGSDLLCFVNWGEIDLSTEIWEGILKDILPLTRRKSGKPISFFDLSDCSKRDAGSISKALELVNAFSSYSSSILGLNRNEARIVYQCLYGKETNAELEELGESIWAKLKPGILVLHSTKQAVAFSEQGKFVADSFFVADPKISTGAGDNFNAGFCIAQLLSLNTGACLVFANAVAGYYIRNGVSPDAMELGSFLEESRKA